MPLIRYQLGDVGVPSCEICSCGRGLPLLSSVEGRINDFLVFSDGRVLTTRQIASRLNIVKGVAIYRLTQRTLDRLDLEFVRSRFYVEETPEEARQRCMSLLPRGVQIKVKETSQTTLPPKIRPVISKVSEKRLLNLISDIPS
jgi:phenylacetate-CoA ligase